jgi:LacI family transcriptional regulator
MNRIPKVFLLIEQSRGYGRGLIKGITQYTKLHGVWNFYTELPFYYESSKKRLNLFNIVKKWRPDGIIMRETPELDKFMRLGIPAAVVTYSKLKFPGVINISGDHKISGKLAAEHFLENGFKNFAYCGIPDKYWSICRGESFQKRVSKAGYKVVFWNQPGHTSNTIWSKDYEKLKKWLLNLPKPVAVMTCTDDRAENVIEACKTAQLRVPEDVAIIGVDNDELLCELTNPPLSSVALDAAKAGYQAAEALDKAMKNKRNNIDKLIIAKATHVVTRHSTDIFAVEDENVFAALRYITANSKKAIQVADAAKAAGLGVRALQKKFTQHLGRTISQEIDRVRIQLICKFLIETPKPISQIAYDIDFISEGHFSRYFRRLKKMSPREYRVKYQVY